MIGRITAIALYTVGWGCPIIVRFYPVSPFTIFF